MLTKLLISLMTIGLLSGCMQDEEPLKDDQPLDEEIQEDINKIEEETDNMLDEGDVGQDKSDPATDETDPGTDDTGGDQAPEESEDEEQ